MDQQQRYMVLIENVCICTGLKTFLTSFLFLYLLLSRAGVDFSFHDDDDEEEEEDKEEEEEEEEKEVQDTHNDFKRYSLNR